MKKELQDKSMHEMEDTPMIEVLRAAQLSGPYSYLETYLAQVSLTLHSHQWCSPSSIELDSIKTHAPYRHDASVKWLTFLRHATIETFPRQWLLA
jgi:hypothetical protein